ncbi:MAG: TonB-dependent receptor [Pseudomonadota bacterium]
MHKTQPRRAVLTAAIAASFTVVGLPALLAPASAIAQQSSRDAMLEEVIVTARKREELAQDVPLAVSAFSGDQLDALKVQNITNLTVQMPNVATDDIGTVPGIANFSIRGLGINSSIPSIDPTVGTFVDGVYLGSNVGVLLDIFDLESIEVLRGPQGTLFGRNVTGGAVLVNTRGPSDETEFRVRAGYDFSSEGAGAAYAMGAVGGALSDTVAGRVSVYVKNDDGWFENGFDGSDFGANDTLVIRPSLRWRPSDNLEMTFRYEYHEADGDGPAAQNHTNGAGIPGVPFNADRDSFDFAIDEPGFFDYEINSFTWQTDWDIEWGNGTITNIFGWRDQEVRSLSDIDAQPTWLFHAETGINSDQLSNELRYNGQFGQTNLTMGVFYFDLDMEYAEGRRLLGAATGGVAPALTQDGGGLYNVESLAFFGSVDYDISDTMTLTAGLRYTDEDKSANIASLVFNVNAPCNVLNNECVYDFNDAESWDAVSGKLGLTWDVTDDAVMYGSFSRSQRSGGYNLRNTAVDVVNLGPGPFDEEEVDNFEIGYKRSLSNGGRFNAAVFYMTIDDMQREINLADPVAGVVQVIKNTADATISGIEFDTVFPLGESTLLTASLGYINPEYDEVRFDLNGDGVIDGADEDLDLPRAAELTYSIGLNHDIDLGDMGYMATRISYAYRDDAAYTDNNLGFFLDQDILDAGIDWHYGANWTFSIYGRNLLDSVNHGGDTILPTTLGPLPLGGTFSPLARGRTIGLQVTYEM